MQRIDRYKDTEVFDDERGGDKLTVRYDNRGEPYQQGISLELQCGMSNDSVSVFLDSSEAKRLKRFIDRLYPDQGHPQK